MVTNNGDENLLISRHLHLVTYFSSPVSRHWGLGPSRPKRIAAATAADYDVRIGSVIPFGAAQDRRGSTRLKAFLTELGLARQ